jgi:UDP-N-acetylmuramyl tripeptide synthase
VQLLPEHATLVVNANDPRLAQLARQHHGASVSFGVDDATVLGTPNHTAADAVRCPACGGAFGGERFMAHLGVLRCTSCEFATPKPDVVLTAYQPTGFTGSRVTLLMPDGALEISTALVGRYNALNIAAAAAAARALGLNRRAFSEGAAAASRAFGRGEQLTVNGRSAHLHLAKNPTGYNEVLRGILDVDAAPHLLLALNDNWADGQDVSWIWDVDFESVAPQASYLATTGQRAGDVALRLDVAGASRIDVEPELAAAFDQAVAAGDHARPHRRELHGTLDAAFDPGQTWPGNPLAQLACAHRPASGITWLYHDLMNLYGDEATCSCWRTEHGRAASTCVLMQSPSASRSLTTQTSCSLAAVKTRSRYSLRATYQASTPRYKRC